MKLSALKKGDLQGIATELGVSLDGTKLDLEERISQHVLANREDYQGDSRFASVFNPSYSPAKRRAVAASSPVATRVTEDKHSPEQDESSRSESDESPEEEEDDDEEPKLSKTVADARQRLSDSLDASLDCARTASNAIRARLSSQTSLLAIDLTAELLVLLHMLVPLDQTLEFPVPVLRDTFYTVHHVPDFERFLSCRLTWQPLALFAASQLVLPFVAAYYINFTINASPTRRVTRHTAQTTPKLSIDPLVFSVARLIFTYVLHYHCDSIVPLALGAVPYIAGISGVLLNLR
ncbi:hypothetical protein TRVA0_048S01134 [Trichomonascus vanleenenianus]|uniref:uncharacterized protein n=1 Tax=Trichomonascus vanleenenianus TaxID=2268995 RepID=UPI003EC974B9